MQVCWDDVTLGHEAGPAVLTAVTLTFGVGWTGVVGANGAGKSTLLAGLAGEPVVRAGQVAQAPADLAVAAPPQRVEDATDAVLDFAWDFGSEALRWKSRLALGDDDVARWSTLSPGERRRWQLATTLAQRPHVLLLDEPTNHLDARTRDVIVDALLSFDGIGIVVSHDRRLLDALCSRVVRVTRGCATMWKGGYAEARAAWENEDKARAEQFEALRAQAKAERARIADRQRDQRSAEQASWGGTNARVPRDTDLRTLSAPKRAAATAAHLAGRAAGRLARIEDRLAAAEVPRRSQAAMRVDGSAARAPVLARVRASTLERGGVEVLRGVDLALVRDARWWVRGPNGAGKTTLLRALVAELSASGRDVYWLEQAEGDGVDRRSELLGLEPGERGEVLRSAGAMGVDVPSLLASPRWSPGEARKVALALALSRPVSCLVLDEPTNHLDLPSSEALEVALAGWTGALVVATHDAQFGRAVTSTVVEVRDGRAMMVG